MQLTCFSLREKRAVRPEKETCADWRLEKEKSMHYETLVPASCHGRLLIHGGFVRTAIVWIREGEPSPLTHRHCL